MIKELEEIYSPSGMEQKLKDYLQNKLNGICDRVWCDRMGNLHAEKGNNSLKPVFACHMDESGIIVTKITDDGYIKFETIGRVKPEFLVSKRVEINGCFGIISLNAVHLTTKEERKTPVKLSQLFIDIGADSAEQAKKAVMPGDYGTFCTDYSEIGNCVKGRALAGRIGCDAAVRLIKNPKIKNIHVLFAVQREIGCRGTAAAAYGLKTDYAVVYDGIEAAAPGVKSAAVCGGGAVILTRTGDMNADAELIKDAVRIADKDGIAIQMHSASALGQANMIAKNGGSIRCMTLGLPVKYFEAPIQMASKADIDALYKLTERLFEQGE
mgnify:FL=1